MLSSFLLTAIPFLLLSWLPATSASCINDNLLAMFNGIDNGCDINDPICVGDASSLMLLDDNSPGTDCVPCVNTQEIEGIPDLGCSDDQPRCLESSGTEPEWNQAGAYCAAELTRIDYCLNDGEYALHDTYCTVATPICVTTLGGLVPADAGFAGNCCVKCVNTQQADWVADLGCPSDRPRCVLENMTTPFLNTAGDLCKEDVTDPAEETQVGLCEDFSDTATTGADWEAQGSFNTPLSIVNEEAVADTHGFPFVHNYVAQDVLNVGRRVKVDVTMTAEQPTFVGVHFLQKEDHPLYLVLWLDPSLTPGAYAMDGAFVISSSSFGFPTANLGTSFSLEAAITGNGDMTLTVSDFPAGSPLEGQTLGYDLGVYPRHMDTLELTAGISTIMYDPLTAVAFDDFSHTDCAEVQSCYNTGSYGNVDDACTADKPICVLYDGNGQLYANQEGKRCARCINSMSTNLPYLGWNDYGCPQSTPRCVLSDGTTDPPIHYAGEACVA